MNVGSQRLCERLIWTLKTEQVLKDIEKEGGESSVE